MRLAVRYGHESQDRGRQVARLLTVTQAAQALRVSRRTVERRIADGTLPVTRDGRKRLVALPEEASTEPPADTDTTKAQLAQALAECDRLRHEADMLRQRAEDLVSERDYLRQALAAALTTTQKLLPERTGRPWWAFWKRNSSTGEIVA
jgi:excisionase family DNA binding protein